MYCKTLREELRKVQSSAALLERQRNPGVGYWTTRKSESSESRTSISTPTPDTPLRESSPTPSTATSNQNEEEINLEYLRNVILQFLEHKEMRVRFSVPFIHLHIVHITAIPAEFGQSIIHHLTLHPPRDTQIDCQGLEILLRLLTFRTNLYPIIARRFRDVDTLHLHI